MSNFKYVSCSRLKIQEYKFFVTSPKNETINFNEIFLLILSRNFCWQYDMKIERGNVQLSLHSVHVDLTISSISILINFYLGKLSPQLFDDQAVEYSFANMACFEISSIYLVNFVCGGKDLNKNSLPQKGPRNPILTLKIWKRDGADVVTGFIRRDRGDFDDGVDGAEESVEEEGGKKFSRTLNVVVAERSSRRPQKGF